MFYTFTQKCRKLHFGLGVIQNEQLHLFFTDTNDFTFSRTLKNYFKNYLEKMKNLYSLMFSRLGPMRKLRPLRSTRTMN